MASITFAVDDKMKEEISNFSWINLSEIVRKEIIRRLLLISQLNSKEEQELMSWSVELGRKVKKGRFEKLLSEISSKTKEKLIKKLHK